MSVVVFMKLRIQSTDDLLSDSQTSLFLTGRCLTNPRTSTISFHPIVGFVRPYPAGFKGDTRPPVPDQPFLFHYSDWRSAIPGDHRIPPPVNINEMKNRLTKSSTNMDLSALKKRLVGGALESSFSLWINPLNGC